MHVGLERGSSFLLLVYEAIQKMRGEDYDFRFEKTELKLPLGHYVEKSGWQLDIQA